MTHHYVLLVDINGFFPLSPSKYSISQMWTETLSRRVARMKTGLPNYVSSQYRGPLAQVKLEGWSCIKNFLFQSNTSLNRPLFNFKDGLPFAIVEFNLCLGIYLPLQPVHQLWSLWLMSHSIRCTIRYWIYFWSCRKVPTKSVKTGVKLAVRILPDVLHIYIDEGPDNMMGLFGCDVLWLYQTDITLHQSERIMS